MVSDAGRGADPKSIDCITVNVSAGRDYGDVPLTVRRVGESVVGRRVMLFIHGWGGSSQYWRPTMDALADIGPSIAPDLPGFGMSRPAMDDRSYTHHGFATILAALLDALGIGTCDVIAHSYGCGPAIHLARAEPTRVRRVMLSNFSTFRSERERKVVELMHRVSGSVLALRRFRFAKSRAFARVLGGQFFNRLPEDAVLQRGLEDFLAMNAHAAHTTVAASLGWDTPQALAELQQPVLLIHSRKDRIMPPGNAPYTASLARRSELIWIDDCGHMPMVEKKREFCTAARTWLAADR